MTIASDLLLTLLRIDESGTFDAAARELHITPSAVSQRIRALEQQIGRVVVVRSKPVRLTDAGQVLVRLARRTELLTREAFDELGVRDEDDRPVPIALAINADSMATWIHPALARFAARHRVVFDISREDQEHTAALLAAGRVTAAVTVDPTPVAGCTSSPLGAMIYRPVASPDFSARWFPHGLDPEALGAAPLIDFNRKDTLQNRWLALVGASDAAPPRHFVPSSTGFLHSVVAGMGWGMVPEEQCADSLRSGDLVDLGNGEDIRVELLWQQWDLRSALLDDLAAEVRAAAAAALAPFDAVRNHSAASQSGPSGSRPTPGTAG